MKKFNLLILFFVFTCFVFAKKTVTFSNLSRPASITIDQNQIIIGDGATICIYSLKDFKIQKKFGKAGEGPEEFKTHPNVRGGSVGISVHPDYILVSSLDKVSYFGRDGTFKNEMKLRATFGQYWPLGEKIVGSSIKQDKKADYFVINFYNSSFEKIKEVYETPFFIHSKKINAVNLLKTPLIYVYQNRIFINNIEGTIFVFDKNGNKLSAIKHDYPKVKVTDQIRKRFDDFFQHDYRFKARYSQLKQMLEFPDYFPPLRSYYVADEKIYVVTYKEFDNKKELFILDLNGKFLKKVSVPLHDMSVLELYPYTIHEGKIYQLIENFEKQDWELVISKIE